MIKMLQQIAGAAEPCQEGGQGTEIKPRRLMSARATGVRNVHVRPADMQMRQVQVRQVKMHGARQQCQRAQREPYQKTDEIEISPGHDRLFGLRAPAAGLSTSSRRSASPEFSRIF